MDALTHIHDIFTMNEWLLLPVLVVLVISLILFKRQRKIQHLQSLSMQSLQRDLRALANAAVGVGGRVLEIERQQRKRPTLVTNHEEPRDTTIPSFDAYGSSNQPYEQAIRMTQSGANVDDIVNVCGLSRSEAELVNMMHRLDKVS